MRGLADGGLEHVVEAPLWVEVGAWLSLFFASCWLGYWLLQVRGA